MGKILRVELTKGKITTEPLKEELVKPYLDLEIYHTIDI